MVLPRRLLLRAAVFLGGGVALAPQPAAAGRAPLGARLAVCRPEGDPLQELLRRNRAFSAAWQAAERSGDPVERAAELQHSWPLHCQVRPTALAQGQRPWAAVLCCADSRVAPEWIFSSGAGELFEVRCAGNTVFDEGVASLEYAVEALEVPLILVMGHSGCGAVQAALGHRTLSPLQEELVAPIRACLRPGDDLSRAVEANALDTAGRLTSRSALLRRACASGRLQIQSAVFDIGSGVVSLV